MAAEPEEARVAAQPTTQQQHPEGHDTQPRPGPPPGLRRASSNGSMPGSRAGWRVRRHRFDFSMAAYKLELRVVLIPV